MFLLHLSAENVDQQKNEENILFIIFVVYIDGHDRSQPCGLFYDDNCSTLFSILIRIRMEFLYIHMIYFLILYVFE